MTSIPASKSSMRLRREQVHPGSNLTLRLSDAAMGIRLMLVWFSQFYSYRRRSSDLLTKIGALMSVPRSRKPLAVAVLAQIRMIQASILNALIERALGRWSAIRQFPRLAVPRALRTFQTSVLPVIRSSLTGEPVRCTSGVGIPRLACRRTSDWRLLKNETPITRNPACPQARRSKKTTHSSTGTLAAGLPVHEWRECRR
jgi:hypothetical protein